MRKPAELWNQVRFRLACSATEDSSVGISDVAANARYYEPEHDKTNKMTWAPSKDTDQPDQF